VATGLRIKGAPRAQVAEKVRDIIDLVGLTGSSECNHVGEKRSVET
jgi:ABC-type methionine transport system ATPase subunit